jgi:hypothetical protein
MILVVVAAGVSLSSLIPLMFEVPISKTLGPVVAAQDIGRFSSLFDLFTTSEYDWGLFNCLSMPSSAAVASILNFWRELQFVLISSIPARHC